MNLYIIGAGGHGKVAADIAHKLQKYQNIFFLDDHKDIDSYLLNFKVLNKINFEFIKSLDHGESYFFVAIGDCNKRKLIQNKLIDSKLKVATLIDPFSSVSQFSSIGVGVIICAGTIVGPNSYIADGTILNHSSTIDHDCNVDSFVHVCPNCSIAGEVKIGHLSTLGIGTKVIQNVSIGNNCFIGAGAVVIKNIPDNKKAYGVPARIID